MKRANPAGRLAAWALIVMAFMGWYGTVLAKDNTDDHEGETSEATRYPVACPAPQELSEEAERIVLSGIVFIDSAWGNTVAQGLCDGAVAAGVKLELRRHHLDFAAERRFLAELITDEVDAVLMMPQNEEASVEMVRQAYEAGIAVLCVGLCLNDRDTERYVAAFLESDQFEVGYRTGTALAHWLDLHPRAVERGPGGEIELGLIHSNGQRYQGFRAAFEDVGLSWRQALSLQGFRGDEALQAIRQIIAEHPEVSLVWTDNSENTITALEELHRTTLPRPIYLFGTDMNAEVASWLLDERNIAQAVGSQVTYKMSRAAVSTALKVVRGELTGPQHIIMESLLYSRGLPDEIRRFLAEEERSPAEISQP